MFFIKPLEKSTDYTIIFVLGATPLLILSKNIHTDYEAAFSKWNCLIPLRLLPTILKGDPIYCLDSDIMINHG